MMKWSPGLPPLLGAPSARPGTLKLTSPRRQGRLDWFCHGNSAAGRYGDCPASHKRWPFRLAGSCVSESLFGRQDGFPIHHHILDPLASADHQPHFDIMSVGIETAIQVEFDQMRLTCRDEEIR